MEISLLSAPTAEPSGAEQMLAEAARRAARQPRGRSAFVLHLSRMSPPGPRPHHRRIARAILQDVAQRHEGQVFAPRNGDLVLLCRSPDASPSDRGGSPAADPASLPATMARLLARDAPDARRLVSVWPLDGAAAALIDYAQARLDEGGTAAASEDDPPDMPGDVDAIYALVADGNIQDMMQRQTAIALYPTFGAAATTGAVPGQALRPLYREISFSIPALEARVRAGRRASADPFLFRHLAGRLDRRMLDVLCRDFGGGGPIDIAAHTATDGTGRPPLNLNLTIPAVQSESFARLARLSRDAGATLGIELSLMEVCAEIADFARTRATIRDAGMTVVLEGVSHLTLLLARPEALGADLVKMDWSPRLPDLGDDESDAVQAAIERLGPHRVVLHRAETEVAIRWGMGRGIRRFQGRHVDAMLGASRIVHCPASMRCTLRQCIERASATGPGGRAGCVNTDLLDAGAPAVDDARPRVTGGERASRLQGMAVP